MNISRDNDDMPVLEVSGLRKDFKGIVAVKDVSFSVRAGEIVGLLGPNGAGKTTTIHMLLGITLPSGGSISYFGRDFFKHRFECLQQINAASAFNTLLGRVSVMENLLVFAGLYGVENPKRKITTLLKRLEIEDLAAQLYWGLSSGQRTRVHLVKSLLNDPKILLMDEPTASLDPDIADKTLSFLEELQEERGISILYTSHNMPEITRICDRVIFLDHGSIAAEDTPQNLTRRFSEVRLRLTFEGGRDEIVRYAQESGRRYELVGERVIELHAEERAVPALLFGASHIGSVIIDIEILKPTLEDVFLQIARYPI